MQVVEMKVDDLKEYENNPRVNDKAVEPVARSIKEFGFKVPIVVDADNVIIAGHTRLKAAKHLGLEKVPCIVANDLNEDQVRAFRLADNKVGELAAWDYNMLAEELELIEMDMDGFGFIELADIDIDSFFEDTEPKDTDEESEPEKVEMQCPHCGLYFEV